MPTCSVTNCWKAATHFNVGDRLRGSYCDEHADLAKGENPHSGGSTELDRIGDAADRRGIESDLDRGDDEDFVIPKAEKTGDISDRSAAVTPAGETISLEDEKTPLGFVRSDSDDSSSDKSSDDSKKDSSDKK